MFPYSHRLAESIAQAIYIPWIKVLDELFESKDVYVRDQRLLIRYHLYFNSHVAMVAYPFSIN
jgi:hypothetical protein